MPRKPPPEPFDPSPLGPQARSATQPAASDEPEVLSKASEAIRPFLRDVSEAPQVAMRLVMAMRMHSGPLPSPQTFEDYERILPGAARDIMNMAEREQTHRHSNENLESLYPFVGLIAGFIALLICIGGAIFLALHAQTAIAALLLGAPLLGAVGWFVNGRLQIKRTAPPDDEAAVG